MERNTLLIVDDVDINREMLKFIFEEQFEILEAEDGDMAIQIIEEKNEQLALMFLDVIMPGKSGLDVLEYMVEKEYMEYIVDSRPIIPAKGPRSSRGKVACGLCEQSYHYSRKELHYGIKLYAVVTRKLGAVHIRGIVI